MWCMFWSRAGWCSGDMLSIWSGCGVVVRRRLPGVRGFSGQREMGGALVACIGDGDS